MRMMIQMEKKLFIAVKWQLLVSGFVSALMVQSSDVVAQEATSERSPIESVVAEGAENEARWDCHFGQQLAPSWGKICGKVHE